MKQYNIPVYNMNTPTDSVNENGVLVFDNHCVVILNKNDKN